MNYTRFFKYTVLFFVMVGSCEQSLDAMKLRNKMVVGTRAPTKIKKKRGAPQALVAVDAQQILVDAKDAKPAHLADALYKRFFWVLDGKNVENAESISKTDCYNLLAHVSGQLFLTLYIATQTNFNDGGFLSWFRPQNDPIYHKKFSNDQLYKYDLLRVFQKVEHQLIISPENLSIQQAQEVIVEALCVMHEFLLKIVRKPLYLYDYSVDAMGQINEDEEIDEDEQERIGGVWPDPIAPEMRSTVRMAYQHFIKFIRSYEQAQAINLHDLNFDAITPMMYIIRDTLVKILDPNFCAGIYRFGHGKNCVVRHRVLFKMALSKESWSILEDRLNTFTLNMRAARINQDQQETPNEIYKNTICMFFQVNMTSACAGTALPAYIDEDSHKHQDQKAILEDACNNVMSWVVTSDQTGELVTELFDREVKLRTQDIQTVLEKPLPELRAVRQIIFDRIRHSAIVDAMNNSIVQDPKRIDHMLQQVIDFVPHQEELFDAIAVLLSCTGSAVREILNSPNAAIRAKIHPAMKRSDSDPVTLLGRTVESIIERNKIKIDTQDHENINVYIDADILSVLLSNGIKYIPSNDNKQFEAMSVEDSKTEMWKALQEASVNRCCLTHPNYIDCILMRMLRWDNALDYMYFLYKKYGQEVMKTIFIQNGVVNQEINLEMTRLDLGIPTLNLLIEKIKEKNQKFVHDEQRAKEEQFADSALADDGKDAAGTHDLLDVLYKQNSLQDEAATCDGFLLSLIMKMGVMYDPDEANAQQLLDSHKALGTELEQELETSWSHYMWSIVKTVRDTMRERAERIGFSHYAEYL